MCLDETYRKVRKDEHLSDPFSIQNGPNKVVLYHNCFSTLL
jgi:hypothetical protein